MRKQKQDSVIEGYFFAFIASSVQRMSRKVSGEIAVIIGTTMRANGSKQGEVTAKIRFFGINLIVSN